MRLDEDLITVRQLMKSFIDIDIMRIVPKPLLYMTSFIVPTPLLYMIASFIVPMPLLYMMASFIVPTPLLYMMTSFIVPTPLLYMMTSFIAPMPLLYMMTSFIDTPYDESDKVTYLMTVHRLKANLPYDEMAKFI